MTADGGHPPCARAPQAPTVPAHFPAGSPTASSSPSERYSSSLFVKILLWPPDPLVAPVSLFPFRIKLLQRVFYILSHSLLSALPGLLPAPHTNTAPPEAPVVFLPTIPGPKSDPHPPVSLLPPCITPNSVTFQCCGGRCPDRPAACSQPW